MDHNGCLPLDTACQNSTGANLNVVEKLLISYPWGARITDGNGCLPIHIVCLKGNNLDVVKMLLREYPQARDDQLVRKYLVVNIDDLCEKIVRDLECAALPDIQLGELMLNLCEEYPSQKVKGDRVIMVLRKNADEVCTQPATSHRALVNWREKKDISFLMLW